MAQRIYIALWPGSFTPNWMLSMEESIASGWQLSICGLKASMPLRTRHWSPIQLGAYHGRRHLSTHGNDSGAMIRGQWFGSNDSGALKCYRYSLLPNAPPQAKTQKSGTPVSKMALSTNFMDFAKFQSRRCSLVCPPRGLANTRSAKLSGVAGSKLECSG